MLAGASGLDLAMLIVAADDSVMPQTREHLEILRLLGLAGGWSSCTKCDLVDPSWLDLVEEDVRSLVRGTFLEGRGDRADLGGDGSRARRAQEGASSRSASAVGPADDPGVFRMAIDRSFTVAGHGTVVTGTVASGSVHGRRRAGVAAGRQAGPGSRPAPARPAGRADRPRLAGRDQPGGCPSYRDPPRPRAGRSGIPRADADPLGRARRVGEAFAQLSATAGATSSTSGRPRSRPCCRCSTETSRAGRAPRLGSAPRSPSRSSRFTASRSSSR